LHPSTRSLSGTIRAAGNGMRSRPTASEEHHASLKALWALSREIVADSRNRRHLAVLRRALRKKRAVSDR
jgi:hypothetical protein